MEIKFREIDKSNYNTCVSLKVGEHQTNYVASNAFSLVQSFYENELYPLGIYNGDEMIGFLLYDYDEELKGGSFSRFMIDIKHQNKGFGSKTLEKFFDFFHNKYPNENLYTSAEIDNEVAIKLYEKYGFSKMDSFEYTVGDITYKEFRMLKKSW
ncbi:GNAT family N-acetyltransferase [Clostridium saccharoperbutylacetonicum]|uniref:GNAT family N-acetyltransferase n=1 Tax=Clostridium saccharoperbutylacetonicum TaxID=36745 RepID=UPI0039E93ADA